MNQAEVNNGFVRTSDGTRLYCRSWGTGKPVLFVHSWALNSDMWQYQMIDLASRGFRCIAYDMRGHGRSGDPGRGYDFDTLAADLASVIEQLDLHDLTIVAHSMGAGETVRYLTNCGAGRVARIALLAPITPFLLKRPDNPDGVDKGAFEDTRAAWRRDFPKWLADNARPFVVPETSPEMVQWLIAQMLQASLYAVCETNRAVAETDFRAEMKKIAVPVLILHGDRDVSAPLEVTGRRSAQLIPKSRLKVYEGAPHGLFITHMDQVNADLREFIAK
jgi:non-heme chloroperoxidase